jgi:hypothetical protein
MLIEVYDPTWTTKQGTISTVSKWNSDDLLDRAGRFSFPMPASDVKADLIQGKRIVEAYAMVGETRTLIGAGVIDERSLRLQHGDEGAEYFVGGNGILILLANTSVLFLELSDGAGAGVTDGIQDILNLASGWSFNTVPADGYNTTATATYGRFAGESVLQALIKVTEKIGEHFRYDSDKKIRWLRTDNTDSGIKAIQSVSPESGTADNVCLIDELTVTYQGKDIVSRIYPFGAGTGGARPNLQITTQAAPGGYTLVKSNDESYLKKDATESAFGIIQRVVSFKDIAPVSDTDADVQAAADVLFDAAKYYLDTHDDEHVVYSLRVVGINQLVYPGQTIRVVYRGYTDAGNWVDIDEDVIILEVSSEVTDSDTVVTGLVVSNYDIQVKTDQELVSNQIGESQIFESHPQMGANSYITSYTDPMDDSKDANLRFWLGDEVTNLVQVILRFRVDPLRSTVKTVAGSSTTTPSGGGSTSGSGGATTPTSANQNANHSHSFAIFGSAISHSLGLTALGQITSPTGGPFTFGGISVQDTSHQHNVTIPNHTHSTPNHQHTFTPNVSATYGIFEEAGGNTLAESDLAYSLNGSADLGGGVVSLGSGWYELDITSTARDASTLRPVQDTNNLVISTAVAKTAQITGQLVVRTIIQAVANV